MGVVKMKHRSGAKPAAPHPSPAPRRHSTPTLNFTIPSDFDSGHDVQRQILAAVESAGYDEQSLFGIRLAVEEALINAIRHGNKFDPTKKVTVRASVNSSRVDITIEDQGPGFQRDGVPDPRLAQNINRCCGRGLLLIEAYMDRVEYSRGGRRIRMIKKNPARP